MFNLRILLLSSFSATLLFSPLLYAGQPTSQVQQLALPSGDLIAPTITFVPPSELVSVGSSQKISAKVTDNVGVQSVTLFYRTVGTESYQRALMSRGGDADHYSTMIFDVQAPGIEYYIQAVDLAGNTLLKGYSFSPLVINVRRSEMPKSERVLTEPEKVAATPTNQEIRDTLEKSSKSDGTNWLWIGLGALAVGGLVASGSDSGGGGGGTSTTATGSIVISAPSP